MSSHVTALTPAALSSLEVPVPRYDRTALRTGIVHLGVGNFHRSHQAMYVDRLLNRGGAADWAVCGVGVLDQDARMRDVMREQSGLYTLLVRSADGSLEPAVLGAITAYLLAPDDPEAVLDRLADPATRIVSLTVTEGGYLRHAATGAFAADDPGTRHDVAHPERPRTAFGYLVEGLRRRRAAGRAPFPVLSCDNLQGNGDVTRQTVTDLARLTDPDLAAWIESEVPFPSSMVDRITPATTHADREVLAGDFGIGDRWPVPAEPFTQWIVEDRFPLGRPALEEVGVQFVDDVAPYERMKLRLLNASHQALAYLGAPLGYQLVDEAVRDDRIRDFLRRYMAQEAAPTLGELPGIDLDAYMVTLLERFANPGIRDTLVRLASDGADRMAAFILPTVRDNLAAGRSVTLGAAVCAAWAHYWTLIGRGVITGDQVPPGVHADALRTAALADDPRAFLEQPAVFGDLARDGAFRAAYLAARAVIAADGPPGLLDSVRS